MIKQKLETHIIHHHYFDDMKFIYIKINTSIM